MNEQLPQWKLLLKVFSCINHSPLLILKMALFVITRFRLTIPRQATMPKCCPHHTTCTVTKRPLHFPSHVPHEAVAHEVVVWPHSDTQKELSTLGVPSGPMKLP